MSSDQRIDVLFVSPERFRMRPQVGTPRTMLWYELGDYLSRHSIGEAKDEAGALSPALYRDAIRRKASLVRIWAMVFDFDESGDVDHVADLLSKYSAIVQETFSSTNDNPRCRVWVKLAAPIDASTYEAVHKIGRGHFKAAGLPADEGAKDASRVSYAPVRRAGAGYRFRLVDGLPLDARRVLAAQPAAPARSAPSLPRPEHRDAYVQGALRRAADAVSTASEGMRHYTLCREAFTLARLGISHDEIESALLPAFIAAAGERRESEGRRTIRDAIFARRGVA